MLPTVFKDARGSKYFEKFHRFGGRLSGEKCCSLISVAPTTVFSSGPGQPCVTTQPGLNFKRRPQHPQKNARKDSEAICSRNIETLILPTRGGTREVVFRRSGSEILRTAGTAVKKSSMT